MELSSATVYFLITSFGIPLIIITFNSENELIVFSRGIASTVLFLLFIRVLTSDHSGVKPIDFKLRGVEDILVACIDGLKGFPEAIAAVFPQTQIQLCIVHQIRTSLRYVPEKDKKAVVEDLKPVYKANNLEQGYEKLLEFEDKWGKKYPLSLKSWLDNWLNLSTYFDYSTDIRRMIYSTNAIEGMHRQIRKVTKTKGAFTSDQALLKLVYLNVKDLSKKWTMPMHNWGLTMSQLYIKFGDRLNAFGDFFLGGG